MKKIVLFMCTLVHVMAYSQQCESFNGGCVPNDWHTGGGTQVREYNNPANKCFVDKGLQTPGVGGNNPARIILPKRMYSNASPNITVSFDLFVFNANMNCASAKEFPCRTYVKLWLVKKGWTSASQEPKSSDVYASQELELMKANGKNSFILSGASIPDKAEYRIVLDFKSPGNCVQGNTKYVLDNVCTSTSSCPSAGCKPFANDDYFSQGENFHGTVLKGNLYGGYALWASSASSEYAARSLNVSPAVNGGADGDADNTALSNVSFSLVSGLTVLASTGCGSNPNPGTLVLQPNGTFTYTKGDNCAYRLQFTYRITDASNQQSNVAKVIIEFPAPITLPVKFASFTAQRKSASQVELRWATAMEQNNRGFYVQRNNGSGWENIAFVFSASADGNSATALEYAYRDNSNNSKGTSQYRIQQVDLDGKVAYSDIRSLQAEAKTMQLQVYPNPTTNGRVTLVIPQGWEGSSVQVMNAAGITTAQYQNVRTATLAIEALTPGMYSIRVVHDKTGASAVHKLVVQ